MFWRAPWCCYIYLFATLQLASSDPPHLPDPPCNVHKFDVTMSDGVVLPSTIYTLKKVTLGKPKLPVNYQAFPYDAFTEKAIVLEWASGLLLSTQPSHILLIQHMRGTAQAPGKFAGFHVSSDIADTVTWMSKQYWWNGVLFGTGTSAMGVMSYLSALAGVPMKAQAVQVAAANEYRMVYQNGAFRPALINGMLTFLNRTEYNMTYLEHEEPGSWWDSTSLVGHSSAIKWPAVHVAGWYDVFQQDTIDVYRLFRNEADPTVRDLQFLIIQPKGHCFSGGVVKWSDTLLQQLQSLFTTLSGMLFGVLRNSVNSAAFGNGLRLLRKLAKGIPRIFWFVMGPGLRGTKGNWIAAGDDLPQPKATPFFLSLGGRLVGGNLTADHAVSYIYDPENPFPTHGGNNMGIPPIFQTIASLPCGPWDQRPFYHGRKDVLTFTSAPLTEELAITGQVKAILYVSSNATDTDFTAKLVDVFPNGTRLLLVDGIQRMRWRDLSQGAQHIVSGTVYRIEIDLWSTSYIFPAKHSIGLDISSSNFPRFDANPNSGLPLRVSSLVSYSLLANNTIHMGPNVPSHLLLPVVPLDSVASIGDAFIHRLIPRLNSTLRSSTILV